HAASACLCSPEPATPQISTLSLHDALPISLDNVRVMTRTTVFGVYDGGIYGAIERVSDHLPMPPQFQPRQRLWRIVAKRCVVAAGAVERPIVFPDNDRPGVMMAAAVRTYIDRYGVLPSQRMAVFTSNDDGWRTAEAIQ